MMGMTMMSMIRRMRGMRRVATLVFDILSAGTVMIFVVHFRFSVVYRNGEKSQMTIIAMKNKYSDGEQYDE